MKLTRIQMDRLVRKVFEELKKENILQFKTPEDKVFRRAVELVQEDYDREGELDVEVNRMLDDLEKKNPGEFQRFKMFPLLKRRLAKEKGVVL